MVLFPHMISSGGGGGLAIWYYSPLGKFCHRISSGGGGEGLPYGIISPWGDSAMGFLLGEGLPYGIPSWGTFAIWYNFRGENLPWYLFPYHEICVCVGGGGDLP